MQRSRSRFLTIGGLKRGFASAISDIPAEVSLVNLFFGYTLKPKCKSSGILEICGGWVNILTDIYKKFTVINTL